jgi:HSP20 family protein
MVRYDIWDRMRRMQEEMNRIFGDFFQEPALLLPTTRALSSGESLPALASSQPLARAAADLYETDKEIVAKFDLPGVRKSDIEVEAGEDQLCVKVEKKEEYEEKKKDSYFIERSWAGYYRSLPLPPYAKIDGTKAEYKDGVLTVRIPKDESKIKPKKNKVKVD